MRELGSLQASIFITGTGSFQSRQTPTSPSWETPGSGGFTESPCHSPRAATASETLKGTRAKLQGSPVP